MDSGGVKPKNTTNSLFWLGGMKGKINWYRLFVNPDPTLIGPRNHRQQASGGPSELSAPWFDNSPKV